MLKKRASFVEPLHDRSRRMGRAAAEFLKCINEMHESKHVTQRDHDMTLPNGTDFTWCTDLFNDSCSVAVKGAWAELVGAFGGTCAAQGDFASMVM